jgi:hypothetical protein
MKVYELAKELNLKPDDILEICTKLAIPYTSHMNNMSDKHVYDVKVELKLEAAQETPANMREAFGIAQINGQWGVIEFAYDPTKATTEGAFCKRFHSEDCKYKSDAIREYQKFVYKSKLLMEES